MITIIIPVYNSGKYLKRCINSLINQSYKELELIFINDCSTDNSLKILNNYAKKDSRIKVYSNKENSGPSYSRNFGIDIANGEYILFIDSDDWIDKDFCEKLYSAAIKYNADISVGGIIRLNQFHKKYHLKFKNEDYTNDAERKMELCDIPRKSYSCAKLYRLNKLRNTGLKFEQGVYFEDTILTPKIIYYLDSLVVVPDTYYYYWRHSDSIVRRARKNPKMFQDRTNAVQKTQEFFEKHNIDPSKWEVSYKRIRFIGIPIIKITISKNHTQYSILNIIKWTKSK